MGVDACVHLNRTMQGSVLIEVIYFPYIYVHTVSHASTDTYMIYLLPNILIYSASKFD